MGFRRPADAARLYGQVATPLALADAMAGWVLGGARRARTLLEPGAGGFVFTRAALARAPELRATGVEIDRADPPAGATLVTGDFLDDATVDGAYDAILCNPPYVRHHYLEPAYKEEVAARLGGRAGLELSRLSGTHVYFLLRALELLAPGGRLAFLTGAEWLDARYGAPVREHLVASGWLRAVLIARPDAEIFPGVLSTAAVVLVEKLRGPPPTLAAGLDAAELAARVAAGAGTRPFAAPPPARGPRLGDRFRVRRGVATGANAFFVLAPARARALRLRARHLRPCVAGPRDLGPRLLLSVTPPLDAAVRAYLEQGHAEGVDRGYLCSRRSPWYRMERVAPAPLLIGYMARGPLIVVDNAAGAIHLNLLHGIYPRDGTPTRLVDSLRRYLESAEGQAAARAAARRYAGGLVKLEPRDLESVVLPEDFR